jgi:LacI family transcriptional regulator
MEINKLGNWHKSERATLARRLKRSVNVGQGHEEHLWKELLLRLEDSRGAITHAEAAETMRLSLKHGSTDDIINSVASHLRKKVREASARLIPNPGAYVSTHKYAIHVTEDPPSAWKQTIGASVGVLLADATDWFVGKVMQGIVEVANHHRHDLLIDVSHDDPVIEARKLDHLLSRTHGVIIVPASNTTLDASRVLLEAHECVLVDRYLRDLPHVFSVHPDDISAGRQAAIHLQQCGCNRILIVDQGSRSSDRFAITPLEDRVKGCRIEADNNVKVRYLPAAGSDEGGGFEALAQFERKEPLTEQDGIFALTDRLALGCRHYLANRQPGLDPPLISVEGQQFGDFVNPPLTSIGFDMVEMGRHAARVLFAKLQEGDLPQSDAFPHFLLAPTLLKPNGAKRERLPVIFTDAAAHYSAQRRH